MPTTDNVPAAAWTPADLSRNVHAAPDKARRVQRMFAAIAHRYDLNNRLHSLGQDVVWRRRAVELCQVTSADDVLDVACGTGDLTLAFACARPNSVLGLDFTAEMLDIARRKSSHRRDGPAPSFVLGDAMNLPFADATFDVVSIAWGIRNVADPRRALHEFRRVLRPRGRLVVLEFSQPRARWLRWLHQIYMQRIMPVTAAFIAADRSGAYRYLPRSVETFFDPDQFCGLLAECGLLHATQHPMTFGVCTAFLAHVSSSASDVAPDAQ